jgi:ABC-type cobalamin/Fe3+-siderophores transport system ATPase subunit
MTLLLGPPSSGKTTLLLALAGELDPDLKVYKSRRYSNFVALNKILLSGFISNPWKSKFLSSSLGM